MDTEIEFCVTCMGEYEAHELDCNDDCKSCANA
jgi:hypothetical protein